MRPTVVLVPGFGCSVLSRPGSSKNSWLAVRRIATSTDQWMADNRAYFDHASRQYFSAEPLRAHDFGGREGVRDLISDMGDWSSWINIGQGYYGGLIDGLDGRADLVGAPYDFRLVLGDGFERYSRDLRGLVEQHRDVIIVAHSLGAVITRAVLGGWPDAARHVRALVEVCPSHGGTLCALEAMAEGAFYIPVPSASRRERLASMSRSLAGMVLALPNRRAFDEGPPLWVEECGREHRVGRWPWPEVSEAWEGLAAPVLSAVGDVPRGVRHVVLHSSVHDTPASVDRPAGAVTVQGGDGVVTAASALCRTCDHTDILHIACSHRMAPSDGATLGAVHKFL